MHDKFGNKQNTVVLVKLKVKNCTEVFLSFSLAH